MNYKDFFRDKRIAVVGLGPHGELVPDIRFLLRLNAKVSFYDVRSEARLRKYLTPLQDAGLENVTLGKVSKGELVQYELILISHEISRKALFLKEAIEAGVRIEYPDILFLKLAPPISLVGVIGACGKTTVAHMIYTMLQKSFEKNENQGLFYINPDMQNGALTHLKKIKPGDVVVARILDEMVSEYHKAHLSPQVAVVTSCTANMLSGVKHSFGLLEHQIYNNFIIAPDKVIDALKKQREFIPKAKMIRTRNDNGSLAQEAAALFKVPKDVSEEILASWKGLKGHRELVKKIGNIEFFNDGASVTPDSTLFALQSLGTIKSEGENPTDIIPRNIILIFGGAYTGYDYDELMRHIPTYAKMVILLPGSGTLGFRAKVEAMKDIIYKQAIDLDEALQFAKEHAVKGDRVLFSPACDAIGIFASRKERSEMFVRAVRGM